MLKENINFDVVILDRLDVVILSGISSYIRVHFARNVLVFENRVLIKWKEIILFRLLI